MKYVKKYNGYKFKNASTYSQRVHKYNIIPKLVMVVRFVRNDENKVIFKGEDNEQLNF